MNKSNWSLPLNLKWMISALIMSLAFLVGCSPASVEPSADPSGVTPIIPAPVETVPAPESASTEESMMTPQVPETDSTSGEVPQEMFDAVLDDLLANTGGTRADVTFVKAEQVTWNDGSLGCPEPGVMYTQAIIDGYQVVFSVGDTTYDYHLSDRGSFVLCQNSFSPGTGAGTPTQ